MSVTIYWRPTGDKGQRFQNGFSSSLENLKQACGDMLDERNIPALRAMSIASSDQFYNEVADVIERVGSIRVWGEW